MFTPAFWTRSFWTNKFWPEAREGHTVMCIPAGYDVFKLKAATSNYQFPISLRGPVRLKAAKTNIVLPASLDY